MVNHKIIAHRGNLYGKSENENQIDYIQNAITQGFDAEIDLWYYVYSDKLYLGHDEPQYEVEYSWLNQYKNSLWAYGIDLTLVRPFFSEPLLLPVFMRRKLKLESNVIFVSQLFLL